MAIPHGVGSVWAQAAWEVYWKLVDAHGFDPDLYNATGNAGNQRMMLYVNEGLKNTACNPTFTQVRDGILAGRRGQPRRRGRVPRCGRPSPPSASARTR